LPGFGDQRGVELLVEAGFTPVEAIRISTLNGAKFEGKADSIGSLAAGKTADIVVIRGDSFREHQRTCLSVSSFFFTLERYYKTTSQKQPNIEHCTMKLLRHSTVRASVQLCTAECRAFFVTWRRSSVRYWGVTHA
jgi:adenine deaminase